MCVCVSEGLRGRGVGVWMDRLCSYLSLSPSCFVRARACVRACVRVCVCVCVCLRGVCTCGCTRCTC